MSAAYQGAATGAASGAISGGSVGGVPGAVIGGGIGAVSGYLGGEAADRRHAAQQAANQRLQQALAMYSGRTGQLSAYTAGQARGVDAAYRAALQGHLAGQPDLAAQLPGRVSAEQAQFQAAGAPAFQPMAGRSGGENTYLQGVAADSQRRFSNVANPLAAQGGSAQSAMADQDYARQLATQLGGLQPQIRSLSQLQQLQNAQNYEAWMRAQGNYGTERAKADTAGSEQLLYSQLLQSGGAGLAGMFMGYRAPPAGQPVHDPVNTGSQVGHR